MEKVKQRCDETGTLLIFDEIQTGFFRTGKLFAFQHYGVVPDILCMAKAMGGGMPMGAFVSSTEIFEEFKHNPPLNHVTTFGGHPVCCAAGHANLETLLGDDFSQKAYKISEIACHTFRGEGIVEIRGMGAMLGLQLRDSELTQHVVADCMEKGIILGWTLHSNSLIRIAPPLIIDTEVLKDAFTAILASVKKFV